MTGLIVDSNRGRFAPGTRTSPDTEVKPGQRLSPATEFKPGGPAHNKLPLGTVTFRNRFGGQRAFVKVGEPSVWRERAKVVWEQHNGRAIPRGMVIHHRDRNPLNDSPDNLEMLTRAQHAKEHEHDVKAAGFSSDEARERASAARRRRP